MPKTILVTVSDDRQGRKGGVYGKTQKEIHKLLHGFQGLQSIQHVIHETGFMTPMLRNTDAGMNGRCYKPMVIESQLANLNEGDFLIYNDCSPEIWSCFSPQFMNILEDNPDTDFLKDFDLSVIHNLTTQNSDILTAFVKWDYQNIPHKGLGMHIHKYFTTDLCMDTMGLREYENSYQHASGMMCIRKNT